MYKSRFLYEALPSYDRININEGAIYDKVYRFQNARKKQQFHKNVSDESELQWFN